MASLHGQRYKCADLFAGIGGIRKGFELASKNAPLETVFVSEYDKYAAITYATNFQTPSKEIEGIENLRMPVDGAVIYGDITKVPDKALENIPSFDICLAGFPCQAFSLAGKRLGFDDDYKGMSRGTLFQELIRICEIDKPKVVFCENVKGLLNHANGKTFDVIRGAFDQVGYKMFYEVLNSSNFDVPQNRERLYMVAFRNEIAPEFFEFPSGEPTSLSISDILEESPVAARYYLSVRYLETLRKHRERHRAKGNGFGFQIRGEDELAGTLSCGGMGRERNLIIDPRPHDLTPMTNIRGPINNEDIRKMTPREWARLQGFDDDFKLVVADTHLYKQFGNTVTVTVIEAIAEKVLGYLDDLYLSGNISIIRKREIVKSLRKSPKTHGDLLNDLSFTFLSSMPHAVASRCLSNTLQSLKREGRIKANGKTNPLLWELNNK